MSLLAKNKVLWCSFYMLGMGLLAPWSAVLQTMDYLNTLYAEFNPSRIITVCFVATNIVAMFALFFYGNFVWPNKKSRLLAGYITYAGVMVLLPIIDVIVVKVAHTMHPRNALVTGYSIWAVCSGLLGVAAALICTVAYGESAALSPRYTHAFLAGKATSGLFLAVIRIISKAALSDDLAGLRSSTSIFLSAAAAIVLGCVVVVAVVLPRERAAIEALKAKPGLSIQATLEILEHVKQAGSLQLHPTLQQLHQLPTNSTVTANKEISQQVSSLLTPKYSLFEVMSAAMAEVEAQGGLVGFGSGKQQVSVGVLSAAAAAAAKSASVQLVNTPNEDAATDGSGNVTIGKHGRAAWQRKAGLLPVASGEINSSSSSSSTADANAGTDADAGVQVVPLPLDDTAAAADAWRKAADQEQHKQQQQQHDAVPAAATSHDVEAALWSPFQNVLAFSSKHQTSPPASPQAAAAAAAAKLHVGPPRSRYSLERFATGGLVREGLSTASSAWLAVRLVHPYLTAVVLVYVVTNFVFPMCLSPQVGEWPAVGTWYTQILLVAFAVGQQLGNILPIWHPRYPRTTVLCAACSMLVFLPAFMLALVFKAGPAAFITLTFVMMASCSYIAAMVFCLAPHGLLSSDCELVEMLAVLALAVGDNIGLFMSWLWTVPGAFDAPAGR